MGRTLTYLPVPGTAAIAFGRWMLAVLLLLALPAPAVAAAAPADNDVVVIVNKDNPNVIDRAFVVNIYTGAIKGWPDGSPAFPLDQAQDSPAREAFALNVIGKRQATLAAIWSQNIFTGKGLPPKTVNADEEMKRVVSTNRNAIGYIRRSQLDDSVRAVDR